MKGTMKIVSILLTIVMLTFVATPLVSATFAKETGSTAQEILKNMDPGDDYSDIDGKDNIKNMALRIIKIIRYAALIIAVVLIAVFGIKFMLGSAEEKAEYKKSFVPLIIGIVVVFGATYIAQVIFSIASTTTGA